MWFKLLVIWTLLDIYAVFWTLVDLGLIKTYYYNLLLSCSVSICWNEARYKHQQLDKHAQFLHKSLHRWTHAVIKFGEHSSHVWEGDNRHALTVRLGGSCFIIIIIIIIIIRYRQVVRPHRLTCILKVYLSIRLLHLRGRDTQAGSMGTSNPYIQTMGPPSKIGNNVDILSSPLDPVCHHGDTLQPWS